jgi:hypothetical protein
MGVTNGQGGRSKIVGEYSALIIVSLQRQKHKQLFTHHSTFTWDEEGSQETKTSGFSKIRKEGVKEWDAIHPFPNFKQDSVEKNTT